MASQESTFAWFAEDGATLAEEAKEERESHGANGSDCGEHTESHEQDVEP